MSAKKDFDTKLPEDQNVDSGFLTGELSGPCDSGPYVDSGVICDEKISDVDSGVKTITENLSQVLVSDTTRSQSTEIPLQLLFQQDEDGDTQLHIASVHGCEKSVGTLIKVCPDKLWLNTRNDYGHTALHLAVMSGNSLVTRMLVIAGADIGARDFLGDTPVHKATAARHLDCINALLTTVPEHTSRKLTTVLEQKNYNGQACVHLAAAAGSVETMKTLLHYGANINDGERLAGWTPLHIAARRGDRRLVRFLRSRDVTSGARDYAGRLPRHYARRTRITDEFGPLRDDSDSDDDDDDLSDSESDSESVYEKYKNSLTGASINVA